MAPPSMTNIRTGQEDDDHNNNTKMALDIDIDTDMDIVELSQILNEMNS